MADDSSSGTRVLFGAEGAESGDEGRNIMAAPAQPAAAAAGEMESKRAVALRMVMEAASPDPPPGQWNKRKRPRVESDTSSSGAEQDDEEDEEGEESESEESSLDDLPMNKRVAQRQRMNALKKPAPKQQRAPPPRTYQRKRGREPSTSSDDSSDSDAETASSDADEPDSDDDETKELDLILAHRPNAESPEETEYLVKFKRLSYHHLEWLSESAVDDLHRGPKGCTTKLQHYKTRVEKEEAAQKNRIVRKKPREPELFDPANLEPEKIVQKHVGSNKTVSYLVKWAALPYDQATWETEAFVKGKLQLGAHISRFEKWNVAPQFGSDFTRPRLTPGLMERLVGLVRGWTFLNDHKLRDYQIQGIVWLVHNWLTHTSCILGDEMGLGKTVQVIIFFEALRRLRRVEGPFLVVAPLATITHWRREAAGWVDMNVITYLGVEEARDRIFCNEFFYGPPVHPRRHFTAGTKIKFNVVVTTYEWIARDIHRFKPIHWAAIVIDEGHRIKNEEATLLKHLSSLRAEHRVILTGTPVQNRIDELYSVLRYLNPKTVEKTKEEFVARYTPMTEERLTDLFELLGPRLLRREKADVEKSIPAKVEILVKVALPKLQREAYKTVLDRHRAALLGKSNVARVRNVCMELRKCCNHPWLLKDGEDEMMASLGFSSTRRPNYDQVMEIMVRCSAKLTFLDKLLARFREEGHKVLVFSQFVIVLDVIAEYLTWKGLPFETLTGSVAGADRQRAVDRFQDPEDDGFVFLISTRAGGCGITLTGASKVVIYDSDWNPQNDIQAQARAHRIGQTKEVEVYRLLTEKTYEERMFEVASQKLGLDHVILHAAAQTKGAKATGAMGLSSAEIERVLKHGAYDLFKKDQNEEEKEETIDEILERSKRIVHGAKDAAGSAVRGLSGFSEVKFNVDGKELEDDPDFWSKTLPEEVSGLTLARKLNGGSPPETDEEVAEFLKQLQAVCKDEIASLPSSALFKQEDVEKQHQLEALLRQVCCHPKFEQHKESLEPTLQLVIEPRTRTRTVVRRGFGDIDHRQRGGDSAPGKPASRSAALLGCWKTRVVVEIPKLLKSLGFGRFRDMANRLRASGHLPAVDPFPSALTPSLLAARIEAFVDHVLRVARHNMIADGEEAGGPAAKAGKQAKTGAKKKSKKSPPKKKRKTAIQSSGSSSSGDDDDEGEEDATDAESSEESDDDSEYEATDDSEDSEASAADPTAGRLIAKNTRTHIFASFEAVDRLAEATWVADLAAGLHRVGRKLAIHGAEGGRVAAFSVEKLAPHGDGKDLSRVFDYEALPSADDGGAVQATMQAGTPLRVSCRINRPGVVEAGEAVAAPAPQPPQENGVKEEAAGQPPQERENGVKEEAADTPPQENGVKEEAAGQPLQERENGVKEEAADTPPQENGVKKEIADDATAAGVEQNGKGEDAEMQDPQQQQQQPPPVLLVFREAPGGGWVLARSAAMAKAPSAAEPEYEAFVALPGYTCRYRFYIGTHAPALRATLPGVTRAAVELLRKVSEAPDAEAKPLAVVQGTPRDEFSHLPSSDLTRMACSVSPACSGAAATNAFESLYKGVDPPVNQPALHRASDFFWTPFHCLRRELVRLNGKADPPIPEGLAEYSEFWAASVRQAREKYGGSVEGRPAMRLNKTWICAYEATARANLAVLGLPGVFSDAELAAASSAKPYTKAVALWGVPHVWEWPSSPPAAPAVAEAQAHPQPAAENGGEFKKELETGAEAKDGGGAEKAEGENPAAAAKKGAGNGAKAKKAAEAGAKAKVKDANPAGLLAAGTPAFTCQGDVVAYLRQGHEQKAVAVANWSCLALGSRYHCETPAHVAVLAARRTAGELKPEAAKLAATAFAAADHSKLLLEGAARLVAERVPLAEQHPATVPAIRSFHKTVESTLGKADKLPAGTWKSPQDFSLLLGAAVKAFDWASICCDTRLAGFAGGADYAACYRKLPAVVLGFRKVFAGEVVEKRTMLEIVTGTPAAGGGAAGRKRPKPGADKKKKPEPEAPPAEGEEETAKEATACAMLEMATGKPAAAAAEGRKRAKPAADKKKNPGAKPAETPPAEGEEEEKAKEPKPTAKKEKKARKPAAKKAEAPPKKGAEPVDEIVVDDDEPAVENGAADVAKKQPAKKPAGKQQASDKPKPAKTPQAVAAADEKKERATVQRAETNARKALASTARLLAAEPAASTRDPFVSKQPPAKKRKAAAKAASASSSMKKILDDDDDEGEGPPPADAGAAGEKAEPAKLISDFFAPKAKPPAAEQPQQQPPQPAAASADVDMVDFDGSSTCAADAAPGAAGLQRVQLDDDTQRQATGSEDDATPVLE